MVPHYEKQAYCSKLGIDKQIKRVYHTYIKRTGENIMTVKPGNYYIGKITGEFKLETIKNVNGQPVFVVTTATNEKGFELTLAEMKEEKIQVAK